MDDQEKQAAAGGDASPRVDTELPSIVIVPSSDAGDRASEVGGAKKKQSKSTLDPSKKAKVTGKMPMPSHQAGRLTTAFNRLIELKKAKSPEGIVQQAVNEAEKELTTLNKQLDAIRPENELQQMFKDSWIAKNVARKEQYVKQLAKLLSGNEESDGESPSETSSQEEQVAAEEEALLLLEQEQLLRRQELRQRQRKEELQEQQERDELQRKLLEVRARAHSRSNSSARRVGSPAQSERIAFPARLPRLRQPTSAWLDDADANRDTSVVPTRPRVPRDHGEGELMRQLLLGQAKVPCFKGDQLEYVWFRHAFEIQIEQVTFDPVQRLYWLLQCLEGEPHRLVRGCQLAEDAEEGFRRAKGLLNERYGHPVRQSLAFKEKLMSWPAVKSGPELTNFSIHLQQCQHVRLGGSKLAELDAASTILMLANKLPVKLQLSWQTRVVDIEQQREVEFDDFVKFVHRHETARNHPVFGKLGGERKSECGLQTYVTRAEASSTETGAEAEQDVPETTLVSALSDTQRQSDRAGNAFRAPCLFCKGAHPAAKCKKPDITRDQKKEALSGLCFSCLKPGHTARFCKYRLKCDICGGLHPTMLHEDRPPTSRSAPAASSDPPSAGAATSEGHHDEQTTVKENAMLTQGSHRYAMAVVKVKLWTDKTSSITVNALLDAASSATFIRKDIATALEAPTRPVSLNLSTMAGETEQQTSTVQGLKVADLDSNHVFNVGVAYVVDALPEVTTRVSSQSLNQWAHLRDVSASFPALDEPIAMLIGQNVHGAHTPGDVRRGADNEPFAVKTKLGWTLQGPVREGDVGATPKEVTNFTQVNRTRIEQQLQKLYYQDFKDAYDFSRKGFSQEDEEWFRIVEASAYQTESGHFCIALPFRPGAREKLRDNRNQALVRLRHLKRKFAANAAFQKDYEAFVQKMIADGHVERVSDTQPCPEDASTNCNYIPHHGVYHPQKKKIRVVFNCASRYHELSLNDCLLSGPDLTNSIVGVLCRFRQFKVPFAADIEAMFYQVLVPESQRDSLRFLWWEEGGMEREKVVTYRMKVHLFGATSSPSVANYALRRSADNATSEIGNSILRNFYVDDCLKSVDTTEEAVKVANGLIEACSRSGFKLGKFVSSDVQFLQQFHRQQLVKALEEVDLSEDKGDPLGSLQERALGVTWNVKLDRLGFKVQCREDESETITKRSVLARISQVYDPIGMAAPVTIVARMFFQNLNTSGLYTWDDCLNDKDVEQWKRWTTELPQLERSSVERWMGLKRAGESYQLHVFCDASSDAYAAVAYIRRAPRYPNEKAKVAFVFGKARVSPPKVVTIPRLELTAAKLAAEMATDIQEELEVTIESRTIWSDSQTVIKYLNNRTKRFHVFVANRVEAILSKTKVEEWRHVPTQLNPADEATRGLSATELSSSNWLRGPDFLFEAEANWPSEEICASVADEDPEVKSNKESAHCLQVEENERFIESLAERYSNAWKFRRALAVWLRVKLLLHRKQAKQGPFQAEELRAAEYHGIKWLQMECWSKEMKDLEDGRRPAAWLRPLAPKVTNNLLVMQSRTGVDLPIVPDGPLAKLLVREAHVTEGHMGRQMTASSVRRKYWIIHLSKVVGEILRHCSWCQLKKASLGCTRMSALPESRLTPGPPFQTTGVDFFGPFLVRKDGLRECNRVYGVIFSCAVSRAIHLELADSLDISSFVNALRRFCARRGHVKTLISDNASNFSGARDALHEEFDKMVIAHRTRPEVIAALRERNVEWNFTPPMASHFGGFYERLIRCVKDVLMSLMDPKGRQVPLTADLMTTLLCECESILNNRPLTTVSNDPNDLDALTPNHLLLGQTNVSSPLPGSYKDLSKALRIRWKLVQHLTKEFWSRWSKEYVTLLHKRTKWLEMSGRPFRINDVVLLKDSAKLATSPGSLGRITAVYPSKDGEVRVVDVMTSKGSFTRPITKMCLLEAASNSQ